MRSLLVFAVLALCLIIAFTVSVAEPAENVVYLIPQEGTAYAGASAEVEIWVNATEFKSGQVNLTYDSDCVNVTNCVLNETNFPMNGWSHYEGSEWITFLSAKRSLTGIYQIGTLTIQCIRDGCGTRLKFDEESGNRTCKLFGANGSIPVDWKTGKIDCTGSCDVFDTGSGTYPSIAGTHNGTITPYQDIVVDTMYTYPCPGTGGHTEYVLIYNASGPVAEAHWDGYDGDYHNISFDTSFTLLAQQTYNYTIRTGSYPQVHHRSEVTTDNGVIRCDEFTDANGRLNKWVPAIRLFLE